MLGDRLERCARLALGLFVVGDAEQPAQPRVAGEVAGDHYELLAVDLQGSANQGLDASLAARLQEAKSAVDAAGVGDGKRRHLELGRSHRQLVGMRAAIKEGEVRMAVKLYVRAHASASHPLLCAITRSESEITC